MRYYPDSTEVLAGGTSTLQVAAKLRRITPPGGLSITLPSQPLAAARFFNLGYSGLPLDTYLTSLLGGAPVAGYPSAVAGAVVTPPTTNAYIRAIPNTTTHLYLYANLTNIYLATVADYDPLQDWLVYADAHAYSREDAFWHMSATLAFSAAAASARPPRWFWAVYRMLAAGTLANNYTQTTASTPAVTFGAAVNDFLALGNLDRFYKITLNLSTARAGGYTYVLEYPTAVNGSGVPTAWSTLTTLTDGTTGLTVTGSLQDITWDPPADWVPCTINSSTKAMYFVRFRCTSTGTTPVASKCYGEDFYTCLDSNAGTIPVFDYASDVGSKGWLTAAEYAGRAAGKNAHFAHQSRILYNGYGPQRFLTNPGVATFGAWAADYSIRLLQANPSYNGIFYDNFDLKNNFGAGAAVVESTTTYLTDWQTLGTAVWTALAAAVPGAYIVPNVGNPGSTNQDYTVRAFRAIWYEFAFRPMARDWTDFDDHALVLARTLALTPAPQIFIFDSTSNVLYGTQDQTDSRWKMGAWCWFLCHRDANGVCWFNFNGGNFPASTWQHHFMPACARDLGTPPGSYSLEVNLANETTAPASAPSVSTATTGGTIAAGTYLVKITYGNSSCETMGSAATIQVTTGSTSTISIQSPPLSGLTPGYLVYVSGDGGTTYFRQPPTAGTAIGSIVTLTSLTLSGTQLNTTPPQYKVYKALYPNGIVYARPISHKLGVSKQGTIMDLTAVTIALPQPMTELLADNTLGAPVALFTIRAGEGKIFLY